MTNEQDLTFEEYLEQGSKYNTYDDIIDELYSIKEEREKQNSKVTLLQKIAGTIITDYQSLTYKQKQEITRKRRYIFDF